MSHIAAMKQDKSQPSDFWDGLVDEGVASDFLCQSPRTIQKWRVTGFGPVFYKSGRSIRYRRRDLANWIESRRQRSTSDTATA